MSWTSGETIVASRLEDKNDRNVANGYAQLNASAKIPISLLSSFLVTLPSPNTNEWTNESYIDDDDETTAATATNTATLIYDLTTDTLYNLIIRASATSNSGTDRMLSVTVSISHDNSTYYTIPNGTWYVANGTDMHIASCVYKFRYIKIYAYAWGGAGGVNGSIYEMRIINIVQ